MSRGPAPGSPEWQALMTASKIAPALGLSPWESPYSLWRTMRGDVDPLPQTRPMLRGHMLESGILDWFLRDHPGFVETGRQEWHPLTGSDGTVWGGATPDMTGVDTDETVALVDAKTSVSSAEWATWDPNGLPKHYLASSLWQLGCCPSAARVYVAALLGSDLDLHHFVVERAGNENTIAGVLHAGRQFWESLAADDPPALDDSPSTYETVRRMHPDIQDGAEVEVPADLMRRVLLLDERHKRLKQSLDAYKAVLLDHMGAANYAVVGGRRFGRRQPHRDGVSFRLTGSSADVPDGAPPPVPVETTTTTTPEPVHHAGDAA